MALAECCSGNVGVGQRGELSLRYAMLRRLPALRPGRAVRAMADMGPLPLPGNCAVSFNGSASA